MIAGPFKDFHRRIQGAAKGLLALTLVGAAPAPVYDIVIRNGRVLDGAGNPWVRADVAIRNGVIAKVGTIAGSGRREVDARGAYVAPGFIDMMDQSGAVLLKNGAAENKIRMGVTTVISGESGTPVPAAALPSYFRRLERQGISVNFGTYYRAADARVKVMGDGAGAPNASQLEAMRREVATAMAGGAFGISTALVYPPDAFQSKQDLVELAQVVGRCGGYYATHLRDESASLVSAIDEAIEIGEKGGVKVEIFHLKAAFAPQWGKLMPLALARITAARARGVDIAADLYPYTAGGTGIDITVPNHVFEKGKEEAWRRLRDPHAREMLRREVLNGSQPGWSNLVEASGGWSNVVLANSFNPKYRQFHGKSFVDIGKELGKDPADAAWDILLEALPNRAYALYFMIDERDIELALRQPWVSIGTDAAASEQFGKVDGLGLPHPRAYGTFPRVLAEYVRKRGTLTLEDAVRKMTSWPAQRMGLSDRGLIRVGLKADLVVFDLAKVQDVASWTDPTAAPEGIRDVIVNGKMTLENSVYTGAKAGVVLRHACNATHASAA